MFKLHKMYILCNLGERKQAILAVFIKKSLFLSFFSDLANYFLYVTISCFLPSL